MHAAEEGDSTLDIDCQTVLNGLGKHGGPGWLSHKDAWAGVRRSIMHEAGMANVKLRNVKAHQAEGDRTWQEQANEWADYYASLGRLLHEQPTDAMKNQLRLVADELGKVVQLVVRVF